MRASGVVDDVRGLGVHGHVCWCYDDPDVEARMEPVG
jgi:hypothetical protein